MHSAVPNLLSRHRPLALATCVLFGLAGRATASAAASFATVVNVQCNWVGFDSAIHLDDEVRQQDIDHGLGATCYLNKQVRITGNALRFESRRRGVEDDPAVASIRLQLTY